MLIISVATFGQDYQQHKSIHQIEDETYSKMDFSDEKSWDGFFGNTQKIVTKKLKGGKLNKVVFGWHPYWAGSDYLNYQWNYLSDIAYFAYSVDYTNGSYTTIHDWASSPAIDTAMKYGIRVHLTATLFANHNEFFANAQAQQNLIDNLIAQVKDRNAIGINIDFEGMAGSHKDDFTNFMKNLSTQFKKQVPGGIVSVCLYAVDWGGVFDMPELEKYVDLYTIMGYAYYYSGSSDAGPTGQLYLFNQFNYTQSRSVSYYLNEGASPEKLILGVPYFGYEWETESNTVPSSTIGSGSVKMIESIKNNIDGNYSEPHLDSNCLSNYYVFEKEGAWYQTWVEDETSLKYSYKLINQTGIGGVAIWALSYDNGYTEMWELLRDYFTDYAEVPLTDTFWDLGGPTRSYYNNENFVYTIKPSRGQNLSLTFTDFELEGGYDSIYIYDGEDTTAPLIGAYSNDINPGVINSTGSALTLHFFSDNATVKKGWTAFWNASPDITIPITSIISPDWVSENFTAEFNDTDNNSIKSRFYQVLDYNGTEWRANSDYGFIFSDFENNSVSSNWNIQGGTWNVSAGSLHQSEGSATNANLYSALNQNPDNIFLYHLKINIQGTENESGVGLIFFADDATFTNNSYLAFFNTVQNKVQVYKYISGVKTLIAEENVQIVKNLNADLKIVYEPEIGKIQGFIDNTLALEFIDETPLISGSYFSLNTNLSVVDFDEVGVYHSREMSQEISVSSISGEMRYENENSTTPAAKIKSIVMDFNNNFSEIETNFVNVDFSAPNNILSVNDGLSSDIDQTNSITQLSANWTSATDDNSSVSVYWYAVGSSTLADDVYSWKRGNSDIQTIVKGLDLAYGNTYYFSVKPENEAGIVGNATSSNGITIEMTAEPPTAYFSSSVNEICSGDSINFYYEGVNAQNFTWVFAGAVNDTLHNVNPVVSYDNEGIYDVKLIVSNPYGADTLIMNDEITVHKTPEVYFTVSSNEIVLNNVVSFVNLSDNDANNYYWDFGDGTTYSTDFFEDVLEHTYQSLGYFTVSLNVETDYCSAELTKEDLIFVSVANIIENESDLVIYPNPVSDILNIELPNLSQFGYKILEPSGKMVLSGISDKAIDVSVLTSGSYVLIIENDDNVIVSKFIKE